MPAKRGQQAPRHRKKPDPLAREVGRRIQVLRKERHWAFDAFVEETGLGRGYISELERGLVVPSLTALDRIAAALELTIADLVVVGETARDDIYVLTRELSDEDIAALHAHARDLVRAARRK